MDFLTTEGKKNRASARGGRSKKNRNLGGKKRELRAESMQIANTCEERGGRGQIVGRGGGGGKFQGGGVRGTSDVSQIENRF